MTIIIFVTIIYVLKCKGLEKSSSAFMGKRINKKCCSLVKKLDTMLSESHPHFMEWCNFYLLHSTFFPTLSDTIFCTHHLSWTFPFTYRSRTRKMFNTFVENRYIFPFDPYSLDLLLHWVLFSWSIDYNEELARYS